MDKWWATTNTGRYHGKIGSYLRVFFGNPSAERFPICLSRRANGEWLVSFNTLNNVTGKNILLKENGEHFAIRAVFAGPTE